MQDINSEAMPELSSGPEVFKPPAWGGFPLPEGVTLAWGARAIYSIKTTNEPHSMMRAGKRIKFSKAITHVEVDIPWDRMEMAGGSDVERKLFAKWIEKAIAMLRKHCAKQYITGDCDERIEIASDGTDGMRIATQAGQYRLIASPRESYGYLYISAWKVPS